MTVHESSQVIRWALIGNPNTGKTTLFNRLCGLRARTANYPGITADARVGKLQAGGTELSLTDLPGIYALELDQPEADLCRATLHGELRQADAPEVVLVVADAGNIERSLPLLTGVFGARRPIALALTMSDLARRDGIDVDTDAMSRELGVPIVAVDGLHGDGIQNLIPVLQNPPTTANPLAGLDPLERRQRFESALETHVARDPAKRGRKSRTDRLDRVLTHPLLGLPLFAAVMAGIFALVFSIAGYPMDMIDFGVGEVGGFVGSFLDEGPLSRLIVDGVIGGVGSTIIFVPQIALLFFVLSLLEDSGYLARAAFVVDRPLRKFGLPGQAFVPLLTSHACAIPAIMSARLIPGKKDRLAAILVAPFFSCSARIPVYTLLIGFLFPDDPFYAGAAFLGCYALGAVVALVISAIARRSFLAGASPPIVMELPRYRRPRIADALRTMVERSGIFLKKAGTVILVICLGLWLLQEIPARNLVRLIDGEQQSSASAETRFDAYRTYAEVLELRSGEVEDRELRAALEREAASVRAGIERAERRDEVEHSLLGFLGKVVEPLVEPIGGDWQIGVGIVASYAAREVFVGTMAVVLGVGSGEEEAEELTERFSRAKRANGLPLFDRATSTSILVFYVLAMQCLPTLAVTRREAGGWKWAMLQLVGMSVIAYAFALVAYQAVRWFV